MIALIMGGNGGIGTAFIRQLLEQNDNIRIHASYHQNSPELNHPAVHWHQVDATSEHDIKNLCDQFDEIDLCINAIGMLHDNIHTPEKSTRQLSPDYFIKSMSVNALPTLLLARYLAPCFRHKRPVVFATVSARVGSIEENYLGGWYSYRASKAALNMLLKTLSIEWKRCLPNVRVAALHPGTTDTALSRPFQKNVPDDQLFSPEKSTAYMMRIINQLATRESGQFWSFDGEKLPW